MSAGKKAVKHKVFILSETKTGAFFGVKGRIRKAVRAGLSSEGITAPCEVSVLLTDDEGIRARNREFRDMDRPTDVLSFPANSLTPGEFFPENLEKNASTGRVLLGDIAISLERARAQGWEFGHGTKREIQYLTVHSVLHLLGYDHVDEGAEKEKMRFREKEIMKRLGAAED